ncbi:MAG TPA: hypothetical protein VGM03_05165, partial [Phycisphaerae bacterium]
MTRKSLLMIVVGLMVTSSSACTSFRLGPAALTPERPSLGGLEHRGVRHELRDLLDPAYCASAVDSFAREFDSKLLYAGR